MAASALAVLSKPELEQKYASLKSRVAGIRGKVERQAERATGLATQGAVAYLWGSYRAERQAANAEVFTLGGLDPSLTWAIGAYFAAPMVGGQAGHVLNHASAALVSAYAYEAGKESAGRR